MYLQLTNIIWGEADDADDHIVPYPEATEVYCKKNEWSQEADNTKSTEQKTPGTKVDANGKQLESHSNFDPGEGTSTSGVGMNSWPELSLSNTTKADQDSFDTSVPNSLSDIAKLDSTGVETPQLNKDTGIFQNPEEGKVQGDFVDYGWASIGSFDDLDRIFSNEDPIFGNVNLGNTDELWSSKDATNSSIKPFPLSVGSTTEYTQVDDRLFNPGYGKVNDPISHGIQDSDAVVDQAEYAGDKSKPIVKQEQIDFSIQGQRGVNPQVPAVANKLADKVYKPKKLMKGRKKLEEKSDLKVYEEFSGNWSPSGVLRGQYKSQIASPTVQSSPTSILSRDKQPQGPEDVYYQQISNPFVAGSAYGNATNPFSAMPVLSHIHSGEFKHQALLSGYDASPNNADPASNLAISGKPHTMTPQEKIEKLRRRQQIQAMLAIKKQQQQFVHQISCSDQSITQKSSHDDLIQNVEASDLEVEDLSSIPFNPSSPIEQDDSNTIPLAVADNSMDTILYRLQDVISKLDVRIRLCIRDSLFRLAQSAIQRHSSTNNNGRDEQVVLKGEIGGHNRNAKMPEVETETNPIDRTVAHLLFHRPLELSGKPPDTPESPASIKLPHERKREVAVKLPAGCMPETPHNRQNFYQQGTKRSCPLADPEPGIQSVNNVPLDSSENASNNEPADEGRREVKASQ
ncbi:hypothetical protein Tsubulata_036687 [Turnera subulata]|uniref:Protein LNK2 n=1 Tax=Turnera subulata TaxID=218843 RepID=A0A9Q0F9T6_9ROSI|nr:hypothetical protein Tsubulata_036687 [Turnera subulata]